MGNQQNHNPRAAYFGAPIFGVPKKDRKQIRWVIDLKARNEITIRDYMPIPNQGYIRDDVARHPYRSKIDMSNAYYQVRIEPKDEEKNAITAGQHGAWQVKVMLQGDCNAPATMMRIMNTILSPHLGKFVWVYLDDILIFSRTEEEHIEHLRKIFTKLEEHSFHLRMDKCELMIDKIEVLGHTIKGKEIIPSAEKIAHVADFPTPNSKKQLLQFLGIINYLGGHLPHIATVQAPVAEITGTTPLEWMDLQNLAFAQVKKLCSQHMPISPINYTDILQKKTILYLVTDASKVGVGSFLCHGKEFEEARSNIAAMHSRKFTPPQYDYSTTDQALLAIVDALRTFEHKLLGIRFTIVTDHMALRTLMGRTVKNQRQMRWLETIKKFDFDIVHINGSDNILADALSRVYEGISEEELTEDNYLNEENDINTEGFLTDREEEDSLLTNDKTPPLWKTDSAMNTNQSPSWQSSQDSRWLESIIQGIQDSYMATNAMPTGLSGSSATPQVGARLTLHIVLMPSPSGWTVALEGHSPPIPIIPPPPPMRDPPCEPKIRHPHHSPMRDTKNSSARPSENSGWTRGSGARPRPEELLHYYSYLAPTRPKTPQPTSSSRENKQKSNTRTSKTNGKHVRFQSPPKSRRHRSRSPR